MKNCFVTTFLVCAVVSAAGAQQMPGGRIHPALEKRLSTLAPGETLGVIVELNERVRPAEIVSGLRGVARREKVRAVVNALQSFAAEHQGPLMANLKQKEMLGAAQRVRPFWILNGFAVTAAEPLIRALATRPDVREVRLDAHIPLPALHRMASGGAAAGGEWNIEAIRAPEVWALDPAYDGTGAVIGSFDTGVEVAHPDLLPRYRGNDQASWFDPYGQHSSPYDFHGHGTHTTGIAVGGDASGSSIGVAPGAVWIAAKGWNDDGVGLASAFHEIFEWFLAPGGDPDNAPDVVNCSWAFDEAGCDAEFLQDIEAWRAAGIFPAFASGNDGPAPGSVRSPGAYPAAFAVGATDSSDGTADFSGQGPTPCDGSVKPDISAPGDGILSAVPGGYDIMSGTSMAAPHITGAVAVLRSIDPSLTVDQLEAALTFAAKDLGDPGPDNISGAGRLDLYVSAQIAIHGPDTPVVKVLAADPLATEVGMTSGLFSVMRAGNMDDDLEVHFSIGGTAQMESDYGSIGGSVIIPAGLASAEIPVTAIDDLLAELPETVVLTIDPAPDYIVSGSDSAVVTIQSDELLSDLSISSLSAPAGGAGAGDSIVLTETTRNQGGGAADPSLTRFYLSANSIFDGMDTHLGGRGIAGMEAGASSSGSTTVVIPSDIVAGSWHVIAVADAESTVIESSESNNILAISIKIGPDLDVTAATAPVLAGAGQSVAISDTVKNVGGGAAAASRTKFFLSANSTFEATDALLGARNVEGLAAGATSSGSTNITLPEEAAAGSWYLIIKADGEEAVPETSESNNILAKAIRIGPDLSISASTVPATAGAGLRITVADTTKNQGGGSSAASRTHYFLSADSVLGVSDTLLGSRDVAALASEATSSGSASVAVPDGTAVGSWFIIIKADGDAAVPETSETNNALARSIKIGPDLAVSAITAPTASGAGRTFTVTDTTKNQGGGDAATSRTEIFMSANSTLDSSDTLLGSRNVAGLGAGKTGSGSTTVTVPEGTPMGTWYILARADADGVVTETSESNNTMSRSIKMGPDLVVTAITAPSIAGAGQTIAVTATTTNQGGGTAGASRTAIYISTDTAFDASDILLGARDLGSLDAGASSAGPADVMIPADMAPGTWYIIAKADNDGSVPETTETNNSYPRTITIGPDLDITAMSAPSTARAGQTIAISDTIKNIGGGSAGASQTYLYLSKNSTLDAADVLLGARTVAELAAGASSAGSTAIVIPSDTAAGTWYIIGKTDGAGAVLETSESNNTFLRGLKVT